LNEAISGAAILAAARGIYFAATMLLFGDLAFSLLIHAKLPVVPTPQDMRMRWTALAAALGAALLWMVMAVVQMAETFDLEALAQALTATLFGQIFLARLAALAALAIVLRRTKFAAPLALAALVLPAATSHAAASSPAGFTLLGAGMDALHLATGGFWLGGLAVLLALHHRHERNILLALSLFSEWAMIGVLLLVMTGLIDGASILLGHRGPASGGYLALLGTKAALAACMLALAAANRFRLMPQGRHQLIARNAKLELGAGVIVVLLAGVLGQLQPTL